jgi:hypothetical protein
VDDLVARIEAVVSDPARELVAAYFTQSDFAGATFDALGLHDDDTFTSDDLVAVTLLDVRFKPEAVRRLLVSEAERFSAMLRKVPVDVALWDATPEQLDDASTLYVALEQLPGVHRTRASKLLARKRPQLVPIADSVIIEQLGLDEVVWEPLRCALQSRGRRARIDRQRPNRQVSTDTSTLRLLDVATWMLGSRSRAAKRVRRKLGLEN